MTEQAELDALRAYLASRDVTCPSCTYNLRGLTADRCPECRQELALRVALAEPRLGVFLVGVVGWALGAGFSVLLLIYAAAESISRGIGNLPDRFVVTLLVGAVVQGGAVVLLLVLNRRIRRWSLTQRVVLSLLGYAASLTNVLIFSATIR